MGLLVERNPLPLWNLIKQVKELFVCHLEGHSSELSEYSVDHEFNKHLAEESSRDVGKIKDYIKTLSNTLSPYGRI